MAKTYKQQRDQIQHELEKSEEVVEVLNERVKALIKENERLTAVKERLHSQLNTAENHADLAASQNESLRNELDVERQRTARALGWIDAIKNRPPNVDEPMSMKGKQVLDTYGNPVDLGDDIPF